MAKPETTTQTNDASEKASPTEPTVTVVKNNEEKIRLIQLPMLDPTGKAIVKNSAGAPELGTVIKLLPGVNLVPTRDLEKAMENQHVVSLFKNKIPKGRAQELNPEMFGRPYLEKGRTLAVRHPLHSINEEEAKDLILDTLDENLLNAWLQEETRADVRSFIDSHVKDLNDGKEGTDDARTKALRR